MLTKEDLRKEIVSLRGTSVTDRQILVNFLLSIDEPVYPMHIKFIFSIADSSLRYETNHEWIGSGRRSTISIPEFISKYKYINIKRCKVDDRFKEL